MYRQVEFSRQTLFDRVWATPVLKLAREIGVSDVALAKACRKVGIPLPGRGHWAIPENRRPKQPKLPSAPPDHPGKVVFSVLDLEHRPAPARSITPRPRILVPDQLESPHRLVTTTLKALKHAKPSDGRIHVSGANGLDVSISPGQADRAVRIIDALIKASELLGMRWSIGQEGTRVYCEGEHIRVRLHETLSKQPIEPPPRKPSRRQPDYAGLWYPRYDWVSKGRLTFMVEDYVANGARRVWASTTATPLEAKLHDVVSGLPLIAAGIRQKREEREAWQRQWEEEQTRRKEAARQAEIQRRLRARLVHSLHQWEQSRRLRDFCNAASAEIAKLEPEERVTAETWLAWARQQADLLDPLGDRVMATSDLQVRLDGWHFNEYQKREDDWWTSS
jgi:hypothetical protein